MKTFNCPSCSGPLEYDEAAEKVVRCRFCGQSVMVPEGWHRKARLVGTPPSAGRGGIIAVTAILLSLGLGVVIFFTARPAKQAIPDELAEALSNLPNVPNLPAPATAALRKATGEQQGFRILHAFGDEGIGPGRFEDGRSIALDQQGHLYVAEYSGGRIQRFDTTGKFLSQWIANPDMPLPVLAASRDGIVYVLQKGIIERYRGATGEQLNPLPKSGRHRYDDLFLLPDGGLLAVSGIGWKGEIIRLDAQGRERLAFPIEALNLQVAADGLGYIYVLGSYNERGKSDEAIFKYDPDGKFLNRFGSTGSGPGQFLAPHAIAVDGQGRVYVSDINGLQVFGSDGRFLKSIEAGGSIFGMAFDDADALYVMERNSSQVRKLAIRWP